MSDEKAPKKPRKKKGTINANTEQTEIPGTEPKRYPKLDELGKLGAELTDAFNETREAMTTTRADILEEMKELGITEYHLTKMARPRWLRIKKAEDKLQIQMDKDGGDPTGDDDGADDKGAGGVEIEED